MTKFLVSESGAAAAEYALILAIVSIGIVVAVTLLADNIGGAIHNAAVLIATPPAAS